jgi:hypothetical protein
VQAAPATAKGTWQVTDKERLQAKRDTVIAAMSARVLLQFFGAVTAR